MPIVSGVLQQDADSHRSPQDLLANGDLSFAASGLKVLGVLFSCHLVGCVEKHGI